MMELGVSLRGDAVPFFQTVPKGYPPEYRLPVTYSKLAGAGEGDGVAAGPGVEDDPGVTVGPGVEDGSGEGAGDPAALWTILSPQNR